MSRGRKPLGPKLVERMEGSGHAKKRLKVILETISGKRSVKGACEALGISEAAFHKMRSEVLTEALGSLEPKARGRPPKKESAQSKEVEELRRQNRELKIDLQASRVREEIAIAMPHLLKKKPKRTRKGR